MVTRVKKYKFINIVLLFSILFSVVPDVQAGWFFNLFKTSQSSLNYKDFSRNRVSGKSVILSLIKFSLCTAATVFCLYKFIECFSQNNKTNNTNQDNKTNNDSGKVKNNNIVDGLNLVENKSNKEKLGSFSILAEIDSSIIDSSFDQLVKNTGTQKYTNKVITLNKCFDDYKNFYGENAKEKSKRIFKDGDMIIIHKAKKAHLTLAEVGNIVIIDGVEYVESFVGGKQVKLEDAVDVVLQTIKKCEEEFNKFSGNYDPRLKFELEDGAKFMYNKNSKKANVWVAQKLKVNKNKRNRFYILGIEIQKALAGIGLKGYFEDFTPHISIANISAINTKNKAHRNTDIIDLLKEFEKDTSTVLRQVLDSINGDVSKKYLGAITINKGFDQEVGKFIFEAKGNELNRSKELGENNDFRSNRFFVELKAKNGVKQVLVNLKVGDLTVEDFSDPGVSAIVNAANPELVGGSGVTGAIWKKSGGLTDLCAIELSNEVNKNKVFMDNKSRKILLKTGQALITGAKQLENVKYVIHTPAPHGDYDYREVLLENCYYNSLSVADENGVDSVAFPSLGTGIYNFPIDGKSGSSGYKGAKEIAIDSVISYLERNKEITSIKEVRFVMMGENYNKYFQELQNRVASGKLSVK